MKRRRNGFWFYDHRHAQSADSLGSPRLDHYKVVNLTVGVSSKQCRASPLKLPLLCVIGLTRR